MADDKKKASSIYQRCGNSSKMDEVGFKDHIAEKSKVTCKALWKDPMYFRWITTFVWALVGAFNFGIVGDFSMFFVYIENDLKAPVMQLNWMGSIPWVLFSVFSPITAPLAKVLGYRWTLIGANMACGIGLFATSFPYQIWPMYITYSIVFGGCSVIYYTAGCVYITSYFDQKTCTGPVSSMGFFFEVAVLVFSPVIQVTADAWGWRWSVRLLATSTLVVTGLLFLFIREPLVDLAGRIVSPVSDQQNHQRLETNDGHESSLELGTDAGPDVDPDYDADRETVMTSRERYMKLFSMPSFWVFELTMIMSYTALSFSHINLGSYLTSIGVSMQSTAALHSFLAGGGIVGRLLVMFVTHKLPLPISSIFPVIAILNCFLSFLILMTSSTVVLYIYSTGVGFLRALYFSLATGLAVELFGIESAAQAYVGLFFTYGMGGVLAAVLPGIAHQLTGSYTVTVLSCAVFWGTSSVLYAVIYILYRRRQRQSSNDNYERGVKKVPRCMKTSTNLVGGIANEVKMKYTVLAKSDPTSV